MGFQTFKLYLTGIETLTQRPTALFFGIVQIVPYWNWNLVCWNWLRSSLTVQIVPYWNWNYSTSVCSFSILEFKLYLTGIETAERILKMPNSGWFKLYLTGIETLISRTIRKCSTVQIVPYWNWNSIGHYSGERYGKVQIVPYWNWNLAAGVLHKGGPRSNCTLLELKRR